MYDGECDLVAPDGQIIGNQNWKDVVHPGWTISMKMWHIPELQAQEISADKMASTDIVDQGTPLSPLFTPAAAGSKTVNGISQCHIPSSATVSCL